MTLMAICGLGYDELCDKIKKGTCPEAHRIGVNPDNLNSYALVFRNGGVTYCYQNYCKHQMGVCEIKFDWLTYRLNLTEKEEAFLKRMGWDFLLDEIWVRANSFYPISGGIEDYYEGTVPARPFGMFAEEGDIIVYYEYDEGGGKRFYDAPDGLKSARLRKMAIKLNTLKSSEDEEFWSDRFSVVEQYEVDNADNCYPYGVIIKHPKNTPFNLLEYTYQKNLFGKFTHIMRHDLTPDDLMGIARKLGSENYEAILKKPEIAETIFREGRIYLSSFHPNQHRLELEGVDIVGQTD